MTRLHALIITIALMTPGLPLAAQEKPAPQMKDSEIQKLATLLDEWKKLDRFEKNYEKKEPKARDAFMKALEQVGSSYEKPAAMADEQSKWKHLLAMVPSWSDIFKAVDGRSKKAASGKGRATDDHVEQEVNGKPVGYEFTYVIPSKYDHKQAWPLIISLPPFDVDSETYTKRVWMDRSVNKELRDQFIILVPTLGKKTMPKKSRHAFTITGFNRYRILNVYWPMREIRKRFNIDPDRIYLDGCREGGEVALRLATLRGKDYAGITVRNARPPTIDLLPNLGEMPLRFYVRKNDVLSNAKDKVLRDEIGNLTKKHGLNIEVKEFEPLDKKIRVAAKKLQDPVFEATADIMKALSDLKRNPYPLKVHFLSNSRPFMRSHWFRVTPTEFDPKNGIFPVVDAKIDRDKNVIDITQQNVDRMNLYLNDHLIDMDRVVKIMVNGKTVVEEKSDRSLDVMLKYRDGNLLDSGVVVTRQIDLKVPEAEEEKEGDEKAAKGEDKAGGDK